MACQHLQRRMRVELGVGAHVVDGGVYSDDVVRFADGVIACQSGSLSKGKSHVRTYGSPLAGPTQSRYVPEALLVDGGQVDHHSEFVACLDQVSSAGVSPGPVSGERGHANGTP